MKTHVPSVYHNSTSSSQLHLFPSISILHSHPHSSPTVYSPTSLYHFLILTNLSHHLLLSIDPSLLSILPNNLIFLIKTLSLTLLSLKSSHLCLFHRPTCFTQEPSHTIPLILISFQVLLLMLLHDCPFNVLTSQVPTFL
jgi:hypothetical protein